MFNPAKGFENISL